MINYKVSVIIPVYNVEKYLRQCLDSVVNQTLKDIEIICVDDGSTDNSGKICDEYAAKDSRIKVIHKENKGISSARNTGIIASTGEYIGFIDSDDFIEDTMFEKLITVAVEKNADLVSCNLCFFWEKENIKISLDNSYYLKVLQNSNFKLLGAEEVFLDDASACTRIYKSYLLKKNNILFDEKLLFSEEILFFRQVLLEAQIIVYIPDILYFYRQKVQNSLMNKKGNNRFFLFDSIIQIIEITKGKKLKKLVPWLNHLIISLLCFGYEGIGKQYQKEYFKKFYDFLIKYNISTKSQIAFPKRFNNNIFSMFYWRYLSLRILHPLSIYSILNKNKIMFDVLIKTRIILSNVPFYIKKYKKIIIHVFKMSKNLIIVFLNN